MLVEYLLGGEQKNIIVLICDTCGFTISPEHLKPAFMVNCIIDGVTECSVCEVFDSILQRHALQHRAEC